MDITNTIEVYHELGVSQDEILILLAMFDKVIITKRSLKRVLKIAKLLRRKNYSDVLNVALYLSQEVEYAGKLLGYKSNILGPKAGITAQNWHKITFLYQCHTKRGISMIYH